MFLKSPKPGFSFTTTLMVLVICMVLTTFSLQNMSRAKRKHFERYHQTKAVWAAESGLAYARSYLENLHQWGELGGIDGKTLNWETEQTAIISAQEMLGFVKLTVIGRCGSRKHQVSAYIGQRPSKTMQHQLVIAEGPTPFFASGPTRIEGSAVIPNGQLVAKQLHGIAASKYPIVLGDLIAFDADHQFHPKPFSKDKIVREILAARAILPTTQSALPKNDVWELAGKTISIGGDLKLPQHIKTIKGPGSLRIAGQFEVHHDLTLASLATVVCGQSFLSTAALKLHGTILTGKNLVMEGSATGTGMLMGAEKMSFSKNVNLALPSWIWLAPLKPLNPKGRSSLLFEGTIQGILASSAETQNQSLIRVRPTAKVTGMILAHDRLILETPMKGHVWARRFETLRGARNFKNWLNGVQISQPETPLHAVPFGFGEGTAILGWEQR